MRNTQEFDGTRARWSTIIAEQLLGVMDWLFGYDYFIAYAHADGKNYPRRLRDHLRARRYKVFLDVEGYAPGIKLLAATERRVSMSNYLVVVARPHGLKSPWVRRELQICRMNGRTPVVVEINRALGLPDVDPEIAELIGDRLHVSEELADPDGEPSEWVLGELTRSFEATRQETRRLRFLALAVAVFLSLTAATGAFAIRSSLRRMDAERQGRSAEAERLAQLSLGTPGDSPRRRLLLAVEAVQATLRAREPVRPSAEEALRKALELNGGRSLVGPREGIGGASFSADGQWLALTDGAGEVRIWDVANADRPPRVLRSNAQSLGVVAFSRDGTRVAASGMLAPRFNGPSTRREDVDVVLVWNLTKPEPQPVILRGHREYIWSLAFSPDRRRLASGSEDETARVWDLERPAQPPVVLLGHEGSVRGLAFSADGGRLVSSADGEGDSTARIWELSRPSHPLTIAGRDRFPGATVSPDARWLLFTGPGGASLLLDLSGKNDKPIPIRDSPADLPSVDKSFSADGRWLASLGDDHSVLVWDLSRPAPPPALRRVVEVRGSITISPNGRRIAAPRDGRDPVILVWDRADATSDPEELTGLEGFIKALIFSPDGSHLAALTVRTPGGQARARIWDLNDPQGSHHVRRNAELSSLSIDRLVLGPDARFLAAGCCDESIRLWDMASASSRITDLEGHQGYFHALAVSTDGVRVASGDEQGIVRFWDSSRASAGPTTLGAHGADFSGARVVSALAFSRDGRQLASAGFDSTVSLWDPGKPGAPIRNWKLKFHADSLAFDSSGGRLAAGGVSLVWVCDLLHPQAIPREFEGAVWNSSIAFSPNTPLFASAGADSQTRLRVWDLDATPVGLTLLPGYDKPVFALTFLPDGRHLATAEHGGIIKVWDLDNISTGPRRWESAEDVIELAVTPDSRWLAGATNNGEILSWPLQLDDLLARAERAAGRNLTLSDWQSFFPGKPYRATFPLLRSPGEPNE